MTTFPIWIARVVTRLAYNYKFALLVILGSQNCVMSGLQRCRRQSVRVGRKVNAGFAGGSATHLPRNQMPITGIKHGAIGWVSLRD